MIAFGILYPCGIETEIDTKNFTLLSKYSCAQELVILLLRQVYRLWNNRETRVRIKGVLQGRGVMASDSEPGNFFSSTPNPPGIKISTPTDPLGKHTETFKMTNDK